MTGASDLAGLTAGSLCTGYGGLDLAAAAVLGARLAWVAEADPHAAAVLARQWPGVPNLGDITALDWAQVPPVDLVTAGWPCQDISYSGTGAGITEGTRSGLWHCIADGLRHLRPSSSSWRTSPRSAPAASAPSSATWPRSGTTRNGSAYARPTPGPAIAATACSPSPGSPPPSPCSPGQPGDAPPRLLPTPIAGDTAPERHGQLGGTRPSGTKRQAGLIDVIAACLAPLPPGRAGGGCCPPPTPAPRPEGTAGAAAGPATATRAGPASTPPPATRPAPAAGGASTCPRSAAGKGSSAAPPRRLPSQALAAGPGCQPSSPSG